MAIAQSVHFIVIFFFLGNFICIEIKVLAANWLRCTIHFYLAFCVNCSTKEGRFFIVQMLVSRKLTSWHRVFVSSHCVTKLLEPLV